jgi:hypothetical protein
MEAGGHASWFERLLAGLQVELWIGVAEEIRARPPDAAELQPSARLTNRGEANKIASPCRRGATGINAADNHARLLFQAPVTTAK